MSGKAQLHRLMAEIGPLLELQEVTEFEAEDLWTLVVDADTVLFLDYQATPERLVLSAEAGVPAEAGREFYATLLQYNNQWAETGGVRLALDGPEGGVVQIVDLALAGLDLSQLQTTLMGFLATLRAWREIVAQAGAGRADTAEPGLAPYGLQGFIRG